MGLQIFKEYPTHKKVLPVFITAGFGVPIIFAIVWISAGIFDGWSFGMQPLSDMGASMSDASKIIFNYGCVLTGVSGLAFGYGIMKYETKWLALTGILTMLGTIFLMGVGAIPENLGTPHLVCAGLFGAFFVAALVTSIIGDYQHRRMNYAGLSTVLLIICVTMGITQPFSMWEAVNIICILVWVGTQAYKYYKLIGLVDIDDQIASVFNEKNAMPGKKGQE